MLQFTVYASDPDGDHVTLTAPIKPVGSTFADNGNNTGTFSWTPDFSQSGTYSVTFTGNDGLATASVITHITVIHRDRPPTADPNGPYFGVIGSPITFDGSGSSDPDGGDALTYPGILETAACRGTG